jgi:hypothetical protein
MVIVFMPRLLENANKNPLVIKGEFLFGDMISGVYICVEPTSPIRR